MNARKLLFLSIVAALLLLTETRGHASYVFFGSRAGDPAGSSTVMVQPVGSTHFSFGFHVGGYRHYGYGGHHPGYGYRHRYYGHGDYHRPYPYRDKYRYRYRHRPYYRDYYYRERHYHDPHYRW